MSTLIRSDKSVSDSYKRVSVDSRSKQWRDLDLSLTLHPIRKDITPLRDDNAIRNAVKNLLLTNFYERPFNHSIGANLRALLFEPADAITRMAIKDNIERTLTEHEPRIKVLDINVQDLRDENAYSIFVKFLIKEFDREEDVEIVLRRIR